MAISTSALCLQQLTAQPYIETLFSLGLSRMSVFYYYHFLHSSNFILDFLLIFVWLRSVSKSVTAIGASGRPMDVDRGVTALTLTSQHFGCVQRRIKETVTYE